MAYIWTCLNSSNSKVSALRVYKVIRERDTTSTEQILFVQMWDMKKKVVGTHFLERTSCASI